MPFQSEKQRRYLHANHPEIAKRWERDYANGGISNHFRRRYFSGAYGQGAGDRGGNPYASRAENIASGHVSAGGGGGPPSILNPPPSGPSPAEIAAEVAVKKKAEATRLQVLEDARSKQIYENTMSKRKKNIKYYDKNLKSKFDTPTWNTDNTFDLQLYNPEAQLIDYYERLDEAQDEEKELNFFEKQHMKELEIQDFQQMQKEWEEEERLDQEQWKDDKPGKFRERKSNWGWEGGKLAFKAGSKKDKKLRALDSERNSAKELGVPFSPKKEKQYQELLKEDKEQTDEPKSVLVGAQGGVARKNYFHGGILDIDTSEEIIDDDGNDIELTAYNAAFDDPNDLSTGVKTLFQAKDGGRIGFFTGMREQEQKEKERATRGPRDDPDRFGPVQTETKTTPPGPDPHGGDWEKGWLDKSLRPGTEEYEIAEKYDDTPLNRFYGKRRIVETRKVELPK